VTCAQFPQRTSSVSYRRDAGSPELGDTRLPKAWATNASGFALTSPAPRSKLSIQMCAAERPRWR